MQIWSAEIKELETLYTSIKGRFPELEKELEQLIETKDANVIMLYSRRCLEVIITDLCEHELGRPRKTEPLKGIIDKLNREEKVPSHIITSMDHLNSLSTYGAHPKEFDPEQVRPILLNLATIIKWYLKYKDSQTISKTKAEEEKDESKPSDVSKEAIRRPIKSIILLIFGFLLIAVIIAYPKIFKRNKLESLRSSDGRISIAVIPFQNMTNDTVWNVWQDGIQDMLITSLSNSEELKVRQIESINNLIQSKGLTNYASITPAFASTISQKLDANVFIYGSIKQAGTRIRLSAQLIDSKTEEVFKSFQIEDSAGEENIFQIIDSLSSMVKDFLIISKLIKEENPDVIKLEATTRFPEAFKCVISGNYAFFTKKDYPAAINMYLKAISIDSNYVWPAIMISYAYWNQSLYAEGKKWCQKVYEKREQIPVYLMIYANIIHSMYFETPYETIKYQKQLLEIDDQLPDVYTDLGFDYNRLEQYSRAIPELEKALEIYDKWGTKPLWVVNYLNLALAYHRTGQYKKVKSILEKAEKDFPGETMLFYAQAIYSLDVGDTIAANRYIEKYISSLKDNSSSEAVITTGLAAIYLEAGIQDSAEKYYRQTLSLEPENPVWMNNLAYFLIDKDQNINQGLELVARALELKPDFYNYLHTKGWGLYKQGKYKEGLEILQKSWDLRRQYAVYNHEAYLHLEAVKKVIANQKNT